MNSYERVMNRLAGKPVDRIPNLSIVMLFAAKELGFPIPIAAGTTGSWQMRPSFAMRSTGSIWSAPSLTPCGRQKASAPG